MKTLYLVVFSISVVLSACAKVSEMREGIMALEGKNIAEAIGVLGEPNEIKKGKSFDSYIWNYQHETQVSDNVRTTSSAATPDLDQTPKNETPSTQSCYIKFEVDKKEIIKGWYYKGDQQGCGVAHTKWIQKLKDYAKTHPKANKDS